MCHREEEKPASPETAATFLRNVVFKAIGLFVALNLVWGGGGVAAKPVERVSLYNLVVPGRLRFPFGEDPIRSYNMSLSSLEAMFASHIIAGRPKSQSEYRVIIIGDSSIWGTLLKPDETLAGVLDQMGLRCGDKTMRFYNLGYPTLALAKDFLILRRALGYDPDAIIWSLTLEAFPRDKQLTSPQVAGNRLEAERAFQLAQLDYSFGDTPSFIDLLYKNSLAGSRREIADVLRLQFYGVMWAATGIDQFYPSSYPPALVDFNDDLKFNKWEPRLLSEKDLAFDLLEAGFKIAGDRPVLILNEPMLISQGRNSQIRYNFYYPRWAYDQYRELLAERAKSSGWLYLDMWDKIPPQEFTNSAIHLSAAGVKEYARLIQKDLSDSLCTLTSK